MSRPAPAPGRHCRSRCRSAASRSSARRESTDPPFDEDGERRNPWWGDPSYRAIPKGTTERDVSLHHLHIDRSFAQRDPDVVLPLRRLDELVAEGVVGESAQTHYSLMGYILDPRELLETSAPALCQRMRAEPVDAAVLIPA